MVFHRVLRPHTVESSRNIGPLSTALADELAHFDGIIKSPFSLFELRVEIVDPFLSVLLEESKEFAFRSPEHLICNVFPLGGFLLSTLKR